MFKGDRHKNYYATTAKAARLRKELAELLEQTRARREEVKTVRENARGTLERLKELFKRTDSKKS